MSDGLPPIPVSADNGQTAVAEGINEAVPVEKPKREEVHLHFGSQRFKTLLETGQITIGETVLLVGVGFELKMLPDAVSLLAKFVYDKDHFVPFEQGQRTIKRLPLNKIGELLRELAKGIEESAVPFESDTDSALR